MQDNSPTARIRRMLTECIAIRDQLLLMRQTVAFHLPDIAEGLPPPIRTPNIDYELAYQRVIGPKVDANRQYAAQARRKWQEAVGLEPSPAPWQPQPEPLPIVKPIQPPNNIEMGSLDSLDPKVIKAAFTSTPDPTLDRYSDKELEEMGLNRDGTTRETRHD